MNKFTLEKIESGVSKAKVLRTHKNKKGNNDKISDSSEKNYDIAILGAGPGGYVAAIKAAQMGAEVALIEKEKPGGTCLNWGCIPTKALVRSAEVYRTIKNADKYGCSVTDLSFDWNRIQKRKDGIVRRLVKGIEHLMKAHSIDLIKGMGNLVDKNIIKIEGENPEKIKADNIIIATGSNSTALPIEGAELPGVIDSRAALELDQLPEKMVIVGGGIIGMEFAFIFAAFEVKVTVVEYLDTILESVDMEIRKEVKRMARRHGIKVITGSRVEKIEQSSENKYNVIFEQKGQEQSVTGDKVLMAVGRKPVYDGVKPEKLGLELNEDNRGIKVNKKMETSLPGIYAIGDVTDKIQLAHVASHQGIVAVSNIMGENSMMDYRAVPSAIFTDPEVGEVGMNEEKAKEKGIEIEIGKFPFRANGKVLTVGERNGFIKIISEKESGKIIGGSIIGIHATDLLAELTLAVNNNLTAEELIETIHAHPTTAEVIHEAALDLEDGAIHYGQ